MNSQDYRNLQEAYLDVYDSDLREEQEFESWVAELLDEGYDLSDYNWDEMYEIYNEARDPGVKPYQGGPEFGMKYSKSKPLSGEKGDGSGYGPPEKFTKPDDKIEKPGTTVPPFKKGGYGRIMSNIPHGIGDHRDKIASKITTTTGGDPGAPKSQKMRTPDKKRLSREIIRKTTINASYEPDLYDLILAHLINEGYADTYEAAESIMVNMSEEWRDDILNEGIGSAIRGLFGKKKEPEAPKPESRGAELRRRYNTGPDKSETSAKRKILDKTHATAESDRVKYGNSPYTQSVADKSAAAHERYLRAGYNKYGADRSDSGGMGGSGGSGRGSKAAKRAAALNNSYDLFDYMMEYLMIEGYADTNENALVIMANMSEEWRESIVDEATDDPIDVDHKMQRLPNNKTPKPTPQQTSAIASALKLRARAKQKPTG